MEGDLPLLAEVSVLHGRLITDFGTFTKK